MENSDIEKDVKILEKRLDKVENIYETISKLTIAVEKLAIETKYLREDQNRLIKRVDSLESKPEKRYDTVVTSIITGVVGAIVGAIVTLLNK